MPWLSYDRAVCVSLSVTLRDFVKTTQIVCTKSPLSAPQKTLLPRFANRVPTGQLKLEKSGKMKNWCHQMSDFQAKCIKFDFRSQTPLGELTALPQTP